MIILRKSYERWALNHRLLNPQRKQQSKSRWSGWLRCLSLILSASLSPISSSARLAARALKAWNYIQSIETLLIINRCRSSSMSKKRRNGKLWSSLSWRRSFSKRWPENTINGLPAGLAKYAKLSSEVKKSTRSTLFRHIKRSIQANCRVFSRRNFGRKLWQK